MAQNPPARQICTGGNATQIAQGIYANVSAPDDAPAPLVVYFTWRLVSGRTYVGPVNGPVKMGLGDGIFAGSFTVPYSKSYQAGGTITIVIYAYDRAGNSAPTKTFTVSLDVCNPV